MDLDSLIKFTSQIIDSILNKHNQDIGGFTPGPCMWGQDEVRPLHYSKFHKNQQ